MHMTYCYLRVPFGQFDEAIDHLSESAEIGRDLDLEEPRLLGMAHTANTLMYMTKFDEGWKATQEACELSEKLGNLMWLSGLKALPPPLYYLSAGDLDTAFSEAGEGASLAARTGASEHEAYGKLLQGLIASLRGDYGCQWRRHVGPLGRSKTVPPGVFMFSEKVRANWPA